MYIPYWYVYSSCINAAHFVCCGMRVRENVGRKKCILHFFKSPCKMRAKYTQFKDDSDRSEGKYVWIMQCRKFFRQTPTLQSKTTNGKSGVYDVWLKVKIDMFYPAFVWAYFNGEHTFGAFSSSQQFQTIWVLSFHWTVATNWSKCIL